MKISHFIKPDKCGYSSHYYNACSLVCRRTLESDAVNIKAEKVFCVGVYDLSNKYHWLPPSPGRSLLSYPSSSLSRIRVKIVILSLLSSGSGSLCPMTALQGDRKAKVE